MTIIFSEKQKLEQIGIKLLFVFTLALVLFATVMLFIKGYEEYIVFPLLFFWIVRYGVLNLSLKTLITDEGVSYQFKPFHRRIRTIKFEEMKTVDIREFRAFRDFGGLGIRKFDNQTAYILSGTTAIVLNLKNNKTVIISSKKKVELIYAYDIIKRKLASI